MVFEDYLQANEVARQLRIHPETVKRLCRQGDIPATKLYNTWLIRREDLQRFAATYDPRPGRKPTRQPRLFE